MTKLLLQILRQSMTDLIPSRERVAWEPRLDILWREHLMFQVVQLYGLHTRCFSVIQVDVTHREEECRCARMKVTSVQGYGNSAISVMHLSETHLDGVQVRLNVWLNGMSNIQSACDM